jgi:hypothetical protein
MKQPSATPLQQVTCAYQLRGANAPKGQLRLIAPDVILVGSGKVAHVVLFQRCVRGDKGRQRETKGDTGSRRVEDTRMGTG